METIYSCDICNYKTKIKYNFTRHCISKIHLIEERNNRKCISCNKSYKSELCYDRHRQLHLNNTLEQSTNNKIIKISSPKQHKDNMNDTNNDITNKINMNYLFFDIFTILKERYNIEGLILELGTISY